MEVGSFEIIFTVKQPYCQTQSIEDTLFNCCSNFIFDLHKLKGPACYIFISLKFWTQDLECLAHRNLNFKKKMNEKGNSTEL